MLSKNLSIIVGQKLYILKKVTFLNWDNVMSIFTYRNMIPFLHN